MADMMGNASESVYPDSWSGDAADVGSTERLRAGYDLYSCCCHERVSKEGAA